MHSYDRVAAAVVAPCPHTRAAAQACFDAKTKPRHSLGRLEELACCIAAIRGEVIPAPPSKAIVLMAADHGVARAGVSAYPQAVTGQMLANFARGGAAINVLSRLADARLVVCDMGVLDPPPADAAVAVRDARIGAGTRDFTEGPAMSRAQAVTAVETGIALAHELVDDGATLLGVGEMGIGNTCAASALAARLLEVAPVAVTGRGTGIDDATYTRKLLAIERALALHTPTPEDPLATLAALGGFEIAGMAGVMIGGAHRRTPVVVDGFIAGVAGLVAARLVPASRGALLCAHRSAEPGHHLVLDALGKEPLLDLSLRLGEASGTALAMSLVDAALALLREMATFSEARVATRLES
jgi:nicotinate-nucleotide--dimethylbenzimidazole phosphoribosyltransferase